MATLQIGAFAGQIPILDAAILPDINAQVALDCWYVNSMLEPIKESTQEASMAGVNSMHLYRPCWQDTTQARWLGTSSNIDIATSPVANDAYGRVFYARHDGLSPPRFTDLTRIAWAAGGAGTFSPCDSLPLGAPYINPFNNGAFSFRLGVPAPAGQVSATVTDDWSSLAYSNDAGQNWSGPSGISSAGLNLKTVFYGGGYYIAGGEKGELFYSTDGATWSAANLSADAQALNATVKCFAVNDAGTMFIAGLSTGQVLYSTNNPGNWSISSGVALGNSINAAIYRGGLFWVAGDKGSTRKGAVSGTAISWTDATVLHDVFGSRNINAGVQFPGGDFGYFVGDGGVVACWNGSAWSKVSTTAVFGKANLIGVAADQVGANRLHIIASDKIWLSVKSGGAPLYASGTTTSALTTATGALAAIFAGDVLTGVTSLTSGLRVLVGTGGKTAHEQNAGAGDFATASSNHNFSSARLNAVCTSGYGLVAVGDAVSTAADDRYYVVTFVDAFGSESAPCAPSGLVRVQAGQPAQVTFAPPAPDDLTEVNTATALFRIYRTNTAANATEFQYVDAVTFVAGQSSYTYTDSVSSASLAEVLPSTDWARPPTALRGLLATPGGALAGFYQNVLCFSEPGQPHAWPVKYQYTVDYPIVGLQAFGNSILIATTGQPYLAEGIDPANMALTKVPGAYACLSRRSIVDLGGQIVYASANGLASVSSTGVELITDKLFTRDQWQALAPTSIRAANWDGRYLMFFDGSGDYIPTGAHSLAFKPEDPLQGVWFYTESGTGPYRDPLDGTVYYVGSAGLRNGWNRGTTRKTLRWRSKQFQTPGFTNFTMAQILTPALPVTFRYFVEENPPKYQQVTYTANYDPVMLTTVIQHQDFDASGQIGPTISYTAAKHVARLRDGRLSRWHALEIETSGKLWQLTLAQSSNELREV